jgi:hypothetical protein
MTILNAMWIGMQAMSIGIQVRWIVGHSAMLHSL